MLAVERQQRILEIVLKSGAMTTTDAARRLKISEETARRDFEKLEADGLLARSHGGAVRLNDNHRDLSLGSREIECVPEKKIIAELAGRQIQTGDTVFFDASSTVFYLARLLPNMAVTVLTTGLKIAIELARRPAVEVILTGGNVGHRTLSCYGNLADSLLQRCHVHKAFLSCRGIDPLRGLSDPTVEQADLKRKMMDLAEQTFMLADHSKIGVKSSWFFAKLTDVDVFIADRKPAGSIARAMQIAGRRIITPEVN